MHRDFAPLFKNRQFMLLWADQILSQVSYNLLNFSLIVIVYKLTQSTLAVSILIIFFYLPALLFSLPAGVVSDFLDKKKVMILADICWALAILLLFLNKDHFWRVLMLTLVAKFFDSFFFPAESAALPQTVEGQRLIEANSLFSFTSYGAMIIGFGLAGPLMRFVGPGAPLLLASTLTLLGALAVFAMKPVKGEGSLLQFLEKGAFLKIISHKIGEGLEFLKTRLIVLGAIAVAVLGQVLATLTANLMPEYAEKSLKISAEDISFVLVLPLASGIVLGLGFLNRFLKLKLKRVSLRLGFGILTLGFLGLSVAPLVRNWVSNSHLFVNGPLPFETLPGVSATAAFFAFLLGVGAALTLIPSLTYSQQNIPAGIRGRAFGLYGTVTAFLIIGLTVPLGGLVGLFGVPFILTTVGLASLGVLLLSFRFFVLN